ncbi:MAG: UDP-2,3-diacylglucosamine diphosphatase [Calditrichota bacterium]
MTGILSLTILDAPVFFLSDAHLGAALIANPAMQAQRLNHLLDRIAQSGRTLVFVGDLFDFWYEWKQVIPKQHFRLLCRMQAFVEQGIAIHYLAGNHDFRLHGFLEHELGMQIHHHHLAAQIGDQSVFVFHGDGILARDHGYRLLKRVLRNPIAQRMFSWLHPDIAMRLAHGTSKTSRAIITMNDNDDTEYLEFARQRFEDGFHGVVLGHTHRPVEHVENGKIYVNLGDWITHYTYGFHDGSRLMLRRYEDE